MYVQCDIAASTISLRVSTALTRTDNDCVGLAELMVQALLLPSLKNLSVSISSKPGDGPGTDSAKWEALLKGL
jgi:hypothetical protein